MPANGLATLGFARLVGSCVDTQEKGFLEAYRAHHKNRCQEIGEERDQILVQWLLLLGSSGGGAYTIFDTPTKKKNFSNSDNSCKFNFFLTGWSLGISNDSLPGAQVLTDHFKKIVL